MVSVEEMDPIPRTSTYRPGELRGSRWRRLGDIPLVWVSMWHKAGVAAVPLTSWSLGRRHPNQQEGREMANSAKPRRTTYANLASTLALVVAIGSGGAAVAASLAKNSVGSPQIRTGGVKVSDIGAGAVNGKKVADNTLSGLDVRDGSIGADELADDSVTGGHILDGEVNGSDLATGSVGADELAENAVTGAAVDESSLGKVGNAGRADTAGQADTAFFADEAKALSGMLTASVLADGTIASHNALRNVDFDEENSRYTLTYVRDVSDCTLIAGVAKNGPGVLTGEATVWTHPTDPEKLLVQTIKVDGAFAPNPFTVLAFCGPEGQ